MNTTFDGLLVAAEHKPATTKYPASNELTFVENLTGETIKISSPVPVDPSQLLVPIRWQILGFKTQLINWTKDGRSGAFLKCTCVSLSGSIIGK